MSPIQKLGTIFTGSALAGLLGALCLACGANDAESQVDAGSEADAGSGADTGRACVADCWLPVSVAGAPSARQEHVAVWTGSEMLIWGGMGEARPCEDCSAECLTESARYDPVADAWSPMATEGAPGPRGGFVAVWSGSELIVWGGAECGGGEGPIPVLASGARYDPVANSWKPMDASTAPLGRHAAAAVWTGDEMVVWGGRDEIGGFIEDGSRYDPVADTWSVMSTVSAPSTARNMAIVVAAGSSMLVWGGTESGDPIANGAIYSTKTDTWSAITTVGAPDFRFPSFGVWSGSKLLFWGMDADLEPVGGRYDPSADAWTDASAAGAPSGFAPAVWTGTKVLVWGVRGGEPTIEGARYDAGADAWTAMATEGAPTARFSYSAVWTGSEMIIWGGFGDPGLLATGGRYRP
jgi:hypothetical protein